LDALEQLSTLSISLVVSPSQSTESPARSVHTSGRRFDQHEVVEVAGLQAGVLAVVGEGQKLAGVVVEAINTHLRRHDTYHSTFEFENGNIFRRTIDDPNEIEFVPVSFGSMDQEQIRAHALAMTSDTLEWDCFTFGIIQSADHFTVYASVDHLHIDGMSAGLIFVDIHLMYQNLSQGRPIALPEVGGYRDYTARQRDKVAGMTLSSPEIRTGSPSHRAPAANGRAFR
jgi:Condensation domain